MTRSLAILTRKNREAHLGHDRMDDGSIVSYDTALANSRRNLIAASHRVESAPLPLTTTTTHAPKSPSLFYGVASIARKVSSRISFRDSSNNNSSNDKNELVAAAAAIRLHNTTEPVEPTATALDQDDGDSDTERAALSHHLKDSRPRRKAGDGLSPPSIIADDGTIATRQQGDDAQKQPRRSQSLPSAKRRGRRSTSITSSSTRPARPTENDDSERRPSSGSKNSASGSSGEFDLKGRSRLRRRSVRQLPKRDEEQLSASLSKLDHVTTTLDNDMDEDREESERGTKKEKTKRRVVVKVRSSKVDADNPVAGSAQNEELIRDALKNVSSRKIDRLLHAKLSSGSHTRRRGSNGAQSCVELGTTSRESLLAKSPALTKSPLRVRLSPGRSPGAALPSINLSRSPMDKPERSHAVSQSHEDIDAPASLLHQSQYSSPGQPLRRSRSKSRGEKGTQRSSTRQRKKKETTGSPRNEQSPTVSPVKSDSSRSPSNSGGQRSSSPKDSHTRREHRRRPTKPEEIESLVLDVDDDANDTIDPRKQTTSLSRSKGSPHSTPTMHRKTKTIHSSLTGSRQSQQPSKVDSVPMRSKSYSVAYTGDSGIVDDLKKEMSESNRKIREQLARSMDAEKSVPQTPRSRARRTLDLENSFPSSRERKHPSDEISVTESVGTATETPRVLRRKRVTARSPAAEKPVRSEAQPTKNSGDSGKSRLGDVGRGGSDSPSPRRILKSRSSGSTAVPELPELRNKLDSQTLPQKADEAPSSSHDNETDTTDMDLHSGDDGFGRTKINYEMDDYEDDDIITLRPTESKSKPVVAAQLQLPGLCSTMLQGDEVSVQYEDVVAYNSDSNAF